MAHAAPVRQHLEHNITLNGGGGMEDGSPVILVAFRQWHLAWRSGGSSGWTYMPGRGLRVLNNIGTKIERSQRGSSLRTVAWRWCGGSPVNGRQHRRLHKVQRSDAGLWDLHMRGGGW
jgi:hypothetical protein